MCGNSACTCAAVWQFVKSYWYDIGDAIAQIIDFGTDINNINVYSKACYNYKQEAQNESIFSENFQDFKNISLQNSTDVNVVDQVKDYITNLLGGNSGDIFKT